MTYLWLTRRSGTPFTAYGPVTRSKPLSSCLRKMTRRPRKRPERRMRMVPGVMLVRSLAVFFPTVFFTFAVGGGVLAAVFAFGAISSPRLGEEDRRKEDSQAA